MFNSTFSRWLGRLALLAVLANCGALHANDTSKAAEQQSGADAYASELEAAVEAARGKAQAGPRSIPLNEVASLQLPESYSFIPRAEGSRLLQAMGNSIGPTFLGLIIKSDESGGWFAVLEYEDSGYIRDDDARDWDAEELLSSLKAGTEETNVMRRERGIPELEIVGWVEAPKYDAATHRLVWSMATKHKGETDEDQGVNYNTYALGRQGYLSLNLVTDLSAIEGQKSIAQELLAALQFKDGQKYADFNESTDRVAEYGLAALVAGVAAKKLGMFAVIAAFVAKFAKIIALAALAVVAPLWNWLKRRRAAAAE